jgi:hypothetical protein
VAELLSDLFAAAQSPVIEWNGRPIYSLYEFTDLPERLDVEFVQAVKTPVQGLRLKMRGGLLTANGNTSADVVLWQDTAPARIRVDVSRHRPVASLKAWNVWRQGQGAIGAWLGDAGMQVTRSDEADRTRLHCSDGVGPATFSDLEVLLHLY